MADNSHIVMYAVIVNGRKVGAWASLKSARLQAYVRIPKPWRPVKSRKLHLGKPWGYRQVYVSGEDVAEYVMITKEVEPGLDPEVQSISVFP